MLRELTCKRQCLVRAAIRGSGDRHLDNHRGRHFCLETAAGRGRVASPPKSAGGVGENDARATGAAQQIGLGLARRIRTCSRTILQHRIVRAELFELRFSFDPRNNSGWAPVQSWAQRYYEAGGVCCRTNGGSCICPFSVYITTLGLFGLLGTVALQEDTLRICWRRVNACSTILTGPRVLFQ